MASRKAQFVLLTLAVSFAVVTLMVAASGGTREKAVAPAAEITAPLWTEREPSPPAARGGRSGAADPDEVVIPSFADIAERANAAVVNITATEIIRGGSRRRAEGRGPFDFFFPNPHGGPDEEDDPERQDHGGSGFVISEDGYILTNHHVVEDADKVSVRLEGDSRDYPARKIGSDPDTDLALLKIDADRSLPVIPLGDSDTLRVGDWVLAIGNPLAYEHTVTVGVVSAKGRKLWAMNRDHSLDNFIQTDAAINRGNSGGPLLNARGEAIGINSAISVAGQGISFAIPINMAKEVVTQLVSTGRVSRGFLGVEIRDVQRDLDPENRQYFGLDGQTGAFVESVKPGLPADQAGLRRGDAIVSVDGKPLRSSDDLIRLISAKIPGQKVKLGIIRDGREQGLEAELTDRAEQDLVARGRRPRPEEGGADSDGSAEPAAARALGLVLHDLSPQLRAEFQIGREVTEGLVVVRVDRTSQAWEKGLREGDVVVELNRRQVKDLASFREAVRGLRPGDLVNLYVSGPGTSRYVTLRVEEE
jgi:serine protease Do